MKLNMMRIIALLLVAISCKAQTSVTAEKNNRSDYISLLGEIATEIQVKTESSRYFKKANFSFDTTTNHYPAIVFCNNKKLLPQAENLYAISYAGGKKGKYKGKYDYHPSEGDLYLEVRIFPPSSEMLLQYDHGKDHLLPDSAGIFLELIAKENAETAKIKQLVWQVVQEVKERDATIKKLEENLTEKNFELLRNYVTKQGKKSSYSGSYPTYQFVFEDDTRNRRFSLKKDVEPIEQKNTEESVIEVSEIAIEKQGSYFPYLILLYAGGKVFIAPKLDFDPLRCRIYYQNALEDFAEQIDQLKKQIIQDEKEGFSIVKLEELLASENFELLRNYILKWGKKNSSYSGLYPSYQVVFEDSTANIRFALKSEIKPDEQKNAEQSAIEISAITIKESEGYFPYLIFFYKKGYGVTINTMHDPDHPHGRAALYNKQALEDYAKRISYIKQEEVLTSENFEMLRDYIIKRGQKSSYSGPHQTYQLIFEDDERNVRFTLKQNAKFINQERVDFVTIEVSEIESLKRGFPPYIISNVGKRITIKSTGLGDLQFGELAYQKALEDFAKRIEYIKMKN